MYDEQKFAQRLTQLRLQKNVSARDMSLSLGQSEGYINKIENGKSLPSMTVFFYISEYFGITPEQFFNYSIEDPKQTDELITEIGRLSPRQAKHLLEVVKDITK